VVSFLVGTLTLIYHPEKCFQYVLLNTKPGSIVVFHDSTKAWDRMSFALPKVLEHFNKQGYRFNALQ
jgi:hypothetical protein